MPDGDIAEREGLLTTIRARRKWYLGVYFLQMLGWLALVAANEVYGANSTDTLSGRIIDNAVIMAFIGQGTLITTIFLMDVVFDGCRWLIKKGGELMGLLFDNFENKFVVRGREQGLKQGLEQGRAQANARLIDWIADNPEVKKMIEDGKIPAPPGLDGDKE